jgi:hypothetical protein
MLDAFDSTFANLLARKIAEESLKRGQELQFGRATTFEDYKHRVGYLLALSDVIAWGKEIESKMRKGETR